MQQSPGNAGREVRGTGRLQMRLPENEQYESHRRRYGRRKNVSLRPLHAEVEEKEGRGRTAGTSRSAQPSISMNRTEMCMDKCRDHSAVRSTARGAEMRRAPMRRMIEIRMRNEMQRTAQRGSGTPEDETQRMKCSDRENEKRWW